MGVAVLSSGLAVAQIAPPAATSVSEAGERADRVANPVAPSSVLVAPPAPPASSLPPASSAPSTSASAVPSTAVATPAPAADHAANPPTGAAGERRGLLIRLQVGGGYRSVSAGVGNNALDVSGTGLGVSILVGGAVAPNLFLYGEYMQEMTSDPTIQLGQKSVVASQASTRLSGFGPGITYLMPQGVHLGGTLLLARYTIESDGKEIGATDLGFGFAARIGKDFWLNDHGALGLVGQLSMASMPDKATTSSSVESPNFGATSFTLALSGTYN